MGAGVTQKSELEYRLSNLDGSPLSLLNSRIPASMLAGPASSVGDGLVSADLTITGNAVRIGRVADADILDLKGRIVWPRTVDCHTHLDKGQTWERSRNSDGSFEGAGVAAVSDRAKYFDAKDLRDRAEFQLRCAYAHGTSAMRSHADADPRTLDIVLGVLGELSADWCGRVDLQLCPFASCHSENLKDVALAARRVGGALSLFLTSDQDLPPALDRALGLAERHGLALDVHADETLDPNSHCLRALAEAVIRTGFEGSVLAGHACALMAQTTDAADRTLDLVARAGISVVCLPLCNSYLMDRTEHRTPRVRGGTLVHEMRGRGIPVAFGSDNVRDGYYAYGDLDMVDLFRHAGRTLQLDHPVGDWPASVTAIPAAIIGSTAGQIRDGGRADLIVFGARNWSEYMARPQSDRIVVCDGSLVDRTAPPHSELDHLRGMHP